MCVILGVYTQFFRNFAKGVVENIQISLSRISSPIILSEYPYYFYNPFSKNSGKQSRKKGEPNLSTQIQLDYIHNISTTPPPNRIYPTSSQPSLLTETYPPIASPAKNLWYLPGYFVP